jgi:hypothetical protein
MEKTEQRNLENDFATSGYLKQLKRNQILWGGGLK